MEFKVLRSRTLNLYQSSSPLDERSNICRSRAADEWSKCDLGAKSALRHFPPIFAIFHQYPRIPVNTRCGLHRLRQNDPPWVKLFCRYTPPHTDRAAESPPTSTCTRLHPRASPSHSASTTPILCYSPEWAEFSVELVNLACIGRDCLPAGAVHPWS